MPGPSIRPPALRLTIPPSARFASLLTASSSSSIVSYAIPVFGSTNKPLYGLPL